MAEAAEKIEDEFEPTEILEEGEGAKADPANDEEDDEIEGVSFGEDDDATPAAERNDPDLPRKLRARIRELEAERRAAPVEQPKTVEVGEKPTLEGCEYDQEKFEQDYDAWKARKDAAESAVSDAQKQREAAQASFRGDLERFSAQRARIKAPDIDDAEDLVSSTLTREQNAMIVSGATNSAALVYALGKHPDRLKALAAIKDPVKFAFAAARIERDIKLIKRNPVQPEEQVRGSARLSQGADKHLERLEKEADKTGNRDVVRAYKKEKGLL